MNLPTLEAKLRNPGKNPCQSSALMVLYSMQRKLIPDKLSSKPKPIIEKRNNHIIYPQEVNNGTH